MRSENASARSSCFSTPMHIQNNYRDTPFGENEVFTERRLLQAEKVCEHTLAKMSEKFPRSPFNRGYVDDFVLPWHSHYSQ